MAVYEQPASQVVETVKKLDVSDVVKTAINSIISQAGQSVKVQEFTGQAVSPLAAEIVSVPQNIQLTADPGGKVVIINANAPGVAATFDATQTSRTIVATKNDDNIRVTGDKPVTIETGGGNDTVQTGQGDDKIVLTGKGKATIDTGEGFDNVQMKGAKATHNIRKVGDKVVINSDVETEAKNVEVIQFEDGKITVVAKTDLEGYVARLYEVLFNREADIDGLKFWFDKAKTLSGKTIEEALKELIAGFMGSQEYAKMYANTNNDQFLKMLYQGMADRAPDTDGYNYWMDKLSKGASRGDIVFGFVASQEAIKVLGDSGNDYVIDLWLT